jgi:chemotaxis protein CheZ
MPLRRERHFIADDDRGLDVQRKVFRIDAMGRAIAAPSGPDAQAAFRHSELLREIRSLRSASASAEEVNERMLESYKLQIAEAQKLKNELDLINDAINRTKHELATVHVTGFQGPEMTRVTNELDAVVDGTESATQNILNAAEEIDQLANTLGASVKTDQEKGLASDIQDKVVQIFESCNFQDLTGQRITKVVSTLQFIETHINRMMEIWGGLEAFREFTPEAFAKREGDAKLLNGPKLATDAGHASQDDIDALFA